MERHAFTLLHEMEGSWWYRGRAAVVRQVLRRYSGTSEKRVLDFGAGYGGMQSVLGAHGRVSAFEPDNEARSVAGTRGYEMVYEDMDAALARPYDLVGLFDVLEHIEDDRAFLKTLAHALTEGGMVVLTVPALPFLWSAHDVSHHHFRRYTRHSLSKLLKEEGYDVMCMSYWNMFLFVPALLARVLGKSGESSFRMSAFVNWACYTLIRFETMLMRLHPLPLGVSLVAVVRKRSV